MNTRHQCRDALTAILTPVLVGAGLPVQAIFGYPPAELHGESPVVAVHSTGAKHTPITTLDNTARYHLQVTVLVLHTDAASWTPALAEDALDDIEALIAAALAANQRTATWHRLEPGISTADLVTISGFPYRREIIPVEIEVLL